MIVEMVVEVAAEFPVSVGRRCKSAGKLTSCFSFFLSGGIT